MLKIVLALCSLVLLALCSLVLLALCLRDYITA